MYLNWTQNYLSFIEVLSFENILLHRRCRWKNNYLYINSFNVHIENKYFHFYIPAVNQPTPVLFDKSLTRNA